MGEAGGRFGRSGTRHLRIRDKWREKYEVIIIPVMVVVCNDILVFTKSNLD